MKLDPESKRRRTGPLFLIMSALHLFVVGVLWVTSNPSDDFYRLPGTSGLWLPILAIIGLGAASYGAYLTIKERMH